MRQCSPAFSQIGVEEDRVDPIHDALRDAFGVHDNVVTDDVQGPDPQYMRNAEARTFFELMEEADKVLYPRCEKYSKLSFLIKLYHIKCLCGISDKGMSMILELLLDAFPEASIPSSFYDAKKIITKLGLKYEKTHSCPNDCMLYRGEYADREICKRCNTSRYKLNGKGKNKKKKPAKILRYFPLKPRL